MFYSIKRRGNSQESRNIYPTPGDHYSSGR
jgi:hypothetical protein